MPIEVVGGQVEPRCGLGSEVACVMETETRALDGIGIVCFVECLDPGVSVLPTAAARRPDADNIAAAINVVVVLPSVPVIATIGRGAPPARS